MRTKICFVWACLLACLAVFPLTGCSDEEEGGKYDYSNGWAPEALLPGTVIAWEGYYVYNGESKQWSEISQIEIIDDSSIMAQGGTGTYRYEKTGENTANLIFSYTQSVGGRRFGYNMRLTFTDRGVLKIGGYKNVSTAGTMMILTCDGNLFE